MRYGSGRSAKACDVGRVGQARRTDGDGWEGGRAREKWKLGEMVTGGWVDEYAQLVEVGVYAAAVGSLKEKKQASKQ